MSNDTTLNPIIPQTITTTITTPSVDEASLLYFILLPTTAGFTEQANQKAGGYHKHFKYNNGSSNDDLFFGVARTNLNPPVTTNVVDDSRISMVIGHELAEAFTERDDNGFTTGPCEIGDICE